jgi:hypothetical protein
MLFITKDDISKNKISITGINKPHKILFGLKKFNCYVTEYGNIIYSIKPNIIWDQCKKDIPYSVSGHIYLYNIYTESSKVLVFNIHPYIIEDQKHKINIDNTIVINNYKDLHEKLHVGYGDFEIRGNDIVAINNYGPNLSFVIGNKEIIIDSLSLLDINEKCSDKRIMLILFRTKYLSEYASKLKNYKKNDIVFKYN